MNHHHKKKVCLEVRSVQMVKKGPPKFLPFIKARRTLAKWSESTFSELWTLTKGLQQSGEHFIQEYRLNFSENNEPLSELLPYSWGRITFSPASWQPPKQASCNHGENELPG